MYPSAEDIYETHRNISVDSLHWDLTPMCGTQVMFLHQTLLLAKSPLLSSLVTCHHNDEAGDNDTINIMGNLTN